MNHSQEMLKHALENPEFAKGVGGVFHLLSLCNPDLDPHEPINWED